MISVKIDAQGLDVIKYKLASMAKQIPFATARAINETAKRGAADGNAKIRSVFDRPLERTANAVKVFQGATKTRLSAIVHIHDGQKGYAIDDPRVLSSGKGSIFPNRYLAAQVYGGQRATKRYESALIKVGAMPAGMQAVFAKRSGNIDAYGNLPGPKIVQILSWFQAFPETGYRANMKQAGKDRLRLGTKDRKTGGRKFAGGRRFGFEYFVAMPPLNLHPGIWERHYPNGPAGKSFIKPVLLFIAVATYRRRFAFFDVMQESVARHMPQQIAAAIDLAIRTAK